MGGSGLSAPFRGVCVHCWAVGLLGCCEQPWGRNSVHKSVEMAPRGRFGAFVYTVGPWAWAVGGLGIAIVYTNGRIGPLRAGLGRLCTLLRCCERPWGRRSVHRSVEMAPRRRFGAFVYTVATRVAIQIAPRAACVRWHERLSRHGVPAAPPRWPLSLGREDRLCASGAAARLASSPRRQPTRTPEEPFWLSRPRIAIRLECHLPS